MLKQIKNKNLILLDEAENSLTNSKGLFVFENKNFNDYNIYIMKKDIFLI